MPLPKVLFAKIHEHEEQNEGHKVSYDLKESVWQCRDCIWMDFPHYSELQIDKMLDAEYHPLNPVGTYRLELENLLHKA